MTLRMCRLAAATIVVLAMSTLASPDANAAEPASVDGVKVLVDKAFAGTITVAEKKVLIEKYPDVAAVVPDWTATEEGVRSTGAATRPAADVTAAAATTCRIYTGWNTLKSVLGFTIYRFEHSATACSNGSTMTSHSSPTYTMSQLDPTVDDYKLMSKSVTGVNTAQSTSRIQVKVTQCVLKVGCYYVSYPTGTIVAKKNNTADITTTLNG